MFTRASKTFAESDFVNSALIEETPFVKRVAKPSTPAHRSMHGSFVDSSADLREGSEVTEFDTVPAELLDLFK